MAARVKKIRHDDETRAKIQAGVIITRFMDHLTGKIDLSPTQVSVGRALLNKVLPDLSAAEIKAEVEHRSVMRMPEPAQAVEEWVDKYAKPAETAH